MPIQPEAVRTGLTATSTQLTPESGPNTTTEDNQLRTGVNAFGKMLGQAANFAKKRQVAQDIRTAENAALREEAMPGGLLPIAIDSYNNIVETNTANRFLSEFELIREGAERKSLITDSKKTTDEKNNIIDNSAEDFFARSAPFISNPQIREKLRTQLNVGRLADKKDILEVEDIQKKLVVIEGMRNQLSDEILLQNEEASGAGLNIGADFLNKMAENATLAHPNIDSQEAKLLAFKIFMQNDDVLSNPQLVTNVLLKEIGKGFVGANLYHSNSKEGKAFKTEVDQFYRENERRETQLDKDNKDALTARISNYNITLAEQLANPDVSRKALLAQLKENTWLGAKAQAGFKTLIENYDDPIELSYDSPEGKKFLNQISSGEIKTKAQVKYQAAMLGFSIKNFDSSLPGMLVNIEVEERAAAKTHIDRSLKVVRGGMVSTINAALSEYGFTNPGLAFDGKKKDEDALYKIIGILSAKGKPKEAKKVQEMYLAIQKFENTMDSRVAKIIQQAAARNIETTSPEMAEAVDRFLNDYETGMDKFILNIKKGIDPGEALTKEKTKVPSTESSTTSSSTSQKKPKIDAMEIFNASALRKEEKITLVETIAEEVAEEEFSRVSRLSTASKVKIDPSATVLSPADKKRLIKENEGFLRGVTQPDQTQPSAWERIQKAGDFLGETGDSMFNAGLDFMRSHTQPDPPESKSFRERTEENERQVAIAPTIKENGEVLAEQRTASIEFFKTFVGEAHANQNKDVGKFNSRKEEIVSSVSLNFPQRTEVDDALLTSIKAETGNFDYQREEIGGGGGYGLFQFTGPQRTSYFKWIKDTNKQDSVSSQVGFVHHLIYDKNPVYEIGAGHQKALQEVFEKGTRKEIIKEFTKRYLRPKDTITESDRRSSLSNEIKDAPNIDEGILSSTIASASVPNIDSSLTYNIKPGDSFSKIAKSNNLSVEELTNLNPNIKNINKIKSGDNLNIGKELNIKIPEKKELNLISKLKNKVTEKFGSVDSLKQDILDTASAKFDLNVLPTHIDFAFDNLKSGLSGGFFGSGVRTETNFLDKEKEVIDDIVIRSLKGGLNGVSYKYFKDESQGTGRVQDNIGYTLSDESVINSFTDPRAALKFTLGRADLVSLPNGDLMLADESDFYGKQGLRETSLSNRISLLSKEIQKYSDKKITTYGLAHKILELFGSGEGKGISTRYRLGNWKNYGITEKRFNSIQTLEHYEKTKISSGLMDKDNIRSNNKRFQ